jgi:hypothetical protein
MNKIQIDNTQLEGEHGKLIAALVQSYNELQELNDERHNIKKRIEERSPLFRHFLLEIYKEWLNKQIFMVEKLRNNTTI